MKTRGRKKPQGEQAIKEHNEKKVGLRLEMGGGGEWSKMERGHLVEDEREKKEMLGRATSNIYETPQGAKKERGVHDRQKD